MKLIIGLLVGLLCSFNSWAESCGIPMTSFTKRIVMAEDRVISLPGLGCVNDLELAGLLPLTNDKLTASNPRVARANLFYWFVESRVHSASTPIILWLNGGPGAASLYGFFIENGPYSVEKQGVLKPRQAAWTDKANYLVIDQPAGVGLSYGLKGAYANEAETMDQLYTGLKAFFERYPELSSRDFYIAGESYAGKYIPQLALRILAGNRAQKIINLQGILIGDGWINPRVQQAANADFAYSHGLIDRTAYHKVLTLYRNCVKEIDKKTPSTRLANQVCGQMQILIQKACGNLNLANIITGKEPNDEAMIRYLNQANVRQAIHADPRVGPFKTFSQMAADTLEIGEQDSVADLYAPLLDKGVRVLIYNGLDDAKDSNFLGTDRWLAVFNWSKRNTFSVASTCVWHRHNAVAGYAKTAAGLTQVKIRNAGHIAPVDQPEVLLDLFNLFIANKPYC